jgi:acetyl esterase
MPLDPQVAAYLKELEALPLPPVSQWTPQLARDLMTATIASLGPPLAIARIAERTIPSPAGPIRVRLYRPRANGVLPCLVFYHGGGWVVGDLDSHDHLCRELAAAADCAIVSVDYRRAPEHPFPAAVEDALAAADWVRRHGHELELDSARVAVGGDSAGGNLAAVVALEDGQRGEPHFPPLALQVLIYPATDYDFETPSYRDMADGYMLTREAMQWYWRQYLPRPGDPFPWRAAPARAKRFGGLPPALVITAEYDPLRDEAELYARNLQAAGVRVRLTRYVGMIHGFVRRLPQFRQAREALQEIAAELRRAFEK